MPPSITIYRFIKESNGNVLMLGYRGLSPVLSVSFMPEKDIRISEEYPFEVVIPVDNSGNIKDFERAKNINVPWERIDFVGSFPSLANPTDPYDAVDKLAEHFFYPSDAFGCSSLIGCNVSLLTNDAGYLTSADLPSNLILYPTTAVSDVPGYFKMVTSPDDVDYDDPAVDVPTGAITGTAQLIASLAASPNLFVGNPGIVNLTTVGDIRRISGTGVAEFYYEVYKRDSLGTESLVATSSNTPPVSQSVYTEFTADALLNNGIWAATDRVVIKYYANRIAGGSNPSYEFSFGGIQPVRTLFPIAANLIVDLPLVIGGTTVTGGTDGYVLDIQSGKVNKRNLRTPIVQSVTSATTITPVSENEVVVITAQAADFTIANPTGTWSQGQPLKIRIKDNGVSRNITFGSDYRAIGVTLPTATTANKTIYIDIMYNSTATKWDVLYVAKEV